MDEKTRENIINCGVPIGLYETGKITLGPMNKSSVGKFASINTLIYENNLPIPPSLITEWIVERCTGPSKQDFREIVDGNPGAGKSMSDLYLCEIYASVAAEIHGQDPKDYFSLDNCALLQDTAGVSHLLDELDKYQAVLIDDAGVSIGNRDYGTSSNKNLAAIMQTCRTKRWYVNFTAPMNKHLDLAIRELVYCKSKIFKSCHSGGFNIMKRKGINWVQKGKAYQEYNPHFVFDGQKIDLYAAFTPDFIDPYKGIVDKYDVLRDSAADSLIHERAEEEHDAKNNVTVREKKFENMMKEFGPSIYMMTHDAQGNWLQRRDKGGPVPEGFFTIPRIARERGLTDLSINKIIALLKKREDKERKKQ